MFNKNVNMIDNISLQKRLARITPEESRVGISYCITPSNDYVLLKDELPADDLQNPREAIKKVLNETIKQEMGPNDIIITFGLGLGYLLDEVFNKYPSKIFIYEPDIMLMHFVLSNVDISEHLASGRVYITNDIDELMNKIGSSYLTKDKLEITYLPNYIMTKNKELLVLTQKVYETCKSKIVDISTITKFSQRWLMNSIDNISNINSGNAYLLSDLYHQFAGQTALIVGAGPSLNDNVEFIKNNRDKFVIFAVNKIVKYLLENEIIPDFVVCMDAGNMDRTLGGLESRFSNVNCIMDIRTDCSIINKGFNKIFYAFSNTDSMAKKLQKYNPSLKTDELGGSATTMAFVSAVNMGFSKVIFVGVDLAFKDNLVYSYGEKMNRISQEQILIDNVQKNVVQVKSVNGGTVYTRDDYQVAIHHFETIIKDLKYNEIYNVSSFGAAIEGVKPAKFEDMVLISSKSLSKLANIQPFKLEIKDFIQEEFFHINNTITMLSKGVFSSNFVSTIVKSIFLYQFLQADILNVLQKNFAPELAQPFFENTKLAIRKIVEKLQNNKMI